MANRYTEKTYKDLHAHRIHLRCMGMLSDKENESVKKKIEVWGKSNKVSTVTEYLATLDFVNNAKQKQTSENSKK